ncbi:ABC transporter ATP-binding protein [Mycoplasmoides alvi]|uniref:ABC transporter ATP-binding protein n=1 Tax=Mycoplasmoides alvi TaxID=78580 RepID=UPI00051BF827|nr:ABC transporter ATP-binding protein [Mycoplasmoides alvi]
MNNDSLHSDKSKYAFEMINIHKSFNNGQIKANVGINLSVVKNSIHAIIGENGAGKSTLMSILFGLYEQDEGEIYIEGSKVKFNSSKDAAKYNIGMVHQHFKLIDNYTVIDNIILGSENTKFGFLTRNKSKQKLNDLINQYGFNINLNDKIFNLTVGQQQKVEILKVLYRDSNILIFDEPTSVLSDNEIESFLKMLRTFKENGKTIVLITHKLNEIKKIADTATIIRKGEYIDTIDVANTSIEKMAELMIGRKIVPVKNDGIVKSNDVLLEVKDLDLFWMPPFEVFFKNIERNIKNYLKKIKNVWSKNKVKENKNFFKNNFENNKTNNKSLNNTFSVHAGEIFAIAGVEGNGQSEVAKIISGLKLSKPNSILFLGKDISKMSIKKRNELGISHVPEDRHKYGLVLDQSSRKNIVNNLISKKPFSQYGFIIEYEIAQYSNEVIRNFDVRGSVNGTANVRSLSGGNQQKLVLGREITKNHKLLLMVQPSRGLDVGAVEYIHQCALKEKDKGNAVILISYEIDEILSISDTVAVMNRNSIVGIGPISEMTRQKIGELIGK